MKNFKVTRIKKFKESVENTENIISDLKTEEETPENENDINTFILKFLTKHQKLQFVSHLKKKLNDMYINSLEDLLTLPAHAWENLQQSHLFGPILTPLLLKEIELKRTFMKSKKKKTKTIGEILGDIHKIKRYLYFETNIKSPITNKVIIEKLPLLDSKAIQKGFREQKEDKKFDGGPILDEIKSYLIESYATHDLPDLVKPSHGMILWGPPGTGKLNQMMIVF